MENEFISYEVAHSLSFKDFNEECFGFYDSNANLKPKSYRSLKSGIKKIDLHELNILAPLYQQVIRWLKNTHSIHIMFSDNESMDMQIMAALKFIKDEK